MPPKLVSFAAEVMALGMRNRANTTGVDASVKPTGMFSQRPAGGHAACGTFCFVAAVNYGP